MLYKNTWEEYVDFHENCVNNEERKGTKCFQAADPLSFQFVSREEQTLTMSIQRLYVRQRKGLAPVAIKYKEY